MATDLKTIASFTIWTLLSTVAGAQDANLKFVDEIVVVEKKNVSQLRHELAKADEQVFALYNDFNTNDALDMICKKETRIGSQIKYRVCKSSYHREVESDAASEFLDGGDVATSSRPPAGHYDEVRSNMAKLMTNHPELGKAVLKRAILRKKIAESKARD